METDVELPWVTTLASNNPFKGLDIEDKVWEYQPDLPMSLEEIKAEELHTDEEFRKLCADHAMLSALDDVSLERVQRKADIMALRDHYVLFEDFLHDCMTNLMGFTCSELQIDIGRFIADESLARIMVQAQRSQAKSTIVAIYAVWKLIHDCSHRVLVISAGADVALEIANWIIQIIMTWDILECMRPDRQHGDRSSTKAFDIHWMLKGPEKSPSVACIGVTANMQGRRADLLIPDDIESSKNGITETQRLALEHLSRDFTSICQNGRIIFMGTPQTVDSIYNNLEKRGYTIRVWPGRYPTKEEEPRYAGRLAPFIAERMRLYPQCQLGGGVDGSRGWATDPMITGLDERGLQLKELDQGPEYFQLQHMLDTTLTDAGRYPLRPRDLVIMDVPRDKGPGSVTWMPRPTLKLDAMLTDHYHCSPELYAPLIVSEKYFDYEFKYVHIDPAGGGENADEVVAVAGYLLNGFIFYAGLVAMQGGHTEDNLKSLAEFIADHQPGEVGSEQNMGHGAFAAMLRPVLAAEYKKRNLEHVPIIEDVWESQQKELRIIETMSPVMAAHRVIIDRSIIEYDYTSTTKYSTDKRDTYKLIHQMARITRDRKSLIHDDRLDTVMGVARRLMEWMGVDEQEAMESVETDENMEFLNLWGALQPEVKYSAVGRYRTTRKNTPRQLNHAARVRSSYGQVT